jgi:hypothetical protein
MDILDWSEGSFELVPGEVSLVDEIGERTSHLLLTHAQLRDEGGDELEILADKSFPNLRLDDPDTPVS